MPKLDTNHYTRQEMNDRGWIWDKTEKYVMQSGQHQDLFGLFDYLAMDPQQNIIIGVQSTVRTEMGRHRDKMCIEYKQRLELWLECGAAAVIWGWYRGTAGKVAPGGKRVRHNTYKAPKGADPRKKVFLWEQELTLRELRSTGPDPILDAGSQ